MIVLLHGQNTQDREKALEGYKKEAKTGELISVDGKEATLTTIRNALTTNPLLDEKRTIIIHNLLSGKPSLFKEIENSLKNTVHTLIFVENKELENKTLSLLPKDTKITYFKPPPIIFYLLDSLGERPAKKSLMLLNDCLKKERPEVILSQIQKRLRLLLALDGNFISDTARLADWQKGKLRQQQKTLSDRTTLKAYKRILEIEADEKQGKATLFLSNAIEIFISNLSNKTFELN